MRTTEDREGVMASRDQRRALLAVVCPWCGAAAGDLCVVRGRARIDDEGGERRANPRRLTMLDEGCHDARWQAALQQPAPVLGDVVAELHTHVVPAPEAPAQPRREPVAVGSVPRPW